MISISIGQIGLIFRHQTIGFGKRIVVVAFMKRLPYFIILLLGTLFLIPTQSRASHNQGVDLTYECLDSCTIRLNLRAYRDCSGITPISNNVTFDPVTPGCGQPTAVSAWSPQFTQEVTPLCATAQTQCTNSSAQINGVQEYFWFRDYNICSVPGCIFTLEWSDCCRNPGITSGASNQGIGISTTTLNTNIVPCNSSPQFSNPPVPYICQGQPYVFNQGATDAEGDSLAYALGQCNTNTNGGSVTYGAGYSAAQPLGSTWNVSINPITGDITVIPNPTGNVVVGVMCVYVEEWRNGTLINTVVRDIQMTVIPCPANTLPVVDSVTNISNGQGNGYVVNTCLGDSLCFDLPVIDPDSGQNLVVFWNQGIPGGVFFETGNPTNVDTITGSVNAGVSTSFCWVANTPGVFAFQVTVQDDGCPIIGQNQFTIQIIVGEVTPGIALTNTGCGAVELCAAPTSGSPPFTFQWTGSGGLSGNPGAMDSCVTHVYPASGTYNYQVLITDSGGCSAIDSGSVTVSIAVTSDAGPDISFCSGSSGTIGATGLPGFTYTWAPATGLSSTTAAQPTVTLSNGGTTNLVSQYVLTTTETSTGCVNSDTVEVTVFPIPTSAFSLPTQTCLNDPVNISYTGSASAAATYTWDFGFGATPASATGLGPHSVSWGTAGNPTVTLSVVENGCVSPVTTQSIQVFPRPTSDFTVTGPHCINTPATITYTGSGGAGSTFNWNFTGGTVVSGTGGGPYQVSWPASGNQFVSLDVTENGCTGSSTSIPVVVTDPGVPSTAVTDVTCNGFSNGAIDLSILGGTSNFSYTWSGPGGFGSGNQDINNLSAGTYNVTVTDAAGCVNTLSSTVGQPSALFTSTASTPSLCNGGASGTATVTASGGTPNPGYNYQWDANAASQTTATAVNLSAGTYSVTVTDGNLCITTATVVVTQPTPLQITTSSTDVFCNGGSTGTASATATGGTGSYTYLWQPGNLAGPTVTGLVAGVYSVVATDGNGCTISSTVTVDEPDPLTATTTTTPNSCAVPTDNGTASAFPLGGNGGYTYQWDDPNTQTSQQATGLAPGIYNVTVTDQLGCTFVTDALVGDILPPDVTAGPSASFCEGEGGAIVTAAGSGGTPGYYYTWTCGLPQCGIDSVFDNDPLVNPTSSTWYYVQAVDTNGCVSDFDSVWVEVLPKPVVDAGIDIILCGDSAPCQNLQPTISNASGPYNYSWFPALGLNDSTLLNPCARPDTTTIYTLVVTGGNGCTSDFTTTDTNATVTVHVNPIPVADAGPDREVCFGDSVQLQGIGSAAGPDYQFQWSPTSGLNNNSITNPMASPILTTDYVLVVISNGCPSYGDTVNVEVHAQPTVDAGPDVEICLLDSVLLDAQADDGAPGTSFTYVWSPTDGLGDPMSEDPMASPASTTLYSVVATSEFGCESAPDSALVTLLPTPIAEAGPNQTICQGTEVTLQGSFFYTTTLPANPNDVFLTWTPDTEMDDPTIATPTVDPLVSTWYYLNVATGLCSTDDSVFVTVIPEIGLTVASDTGVACEGTPVQLTAAAGIGSADYTWIPSAGLDDPTSATPIATPSQTTTYQVVASESGCGDTMEITVEVIPTPTPGYLSSTTEGCLPHTVSFLDASDNVINYIWDFGDGSDVSNIPQPSHEYTEPGTYNVSLTVVNAGGCAATIDDLNILVMNPPTADFGSNQPFPVELALPETSVDFLNMSEGGSKYIWDFGDGGISSEVNPNYTFNEAGEFMVTLTVTNDIGCISEVVHGPFIVFAPDLFIPNVFSPNNDDINDRFMVEYSGSQPFNIQIFDRWGVQVYEATNKMEGWNGTSLDGKVAPEGAYYYHVKVGDREYAGDVTLVR